MKKQINEEFKRMQTLGGIILKEDLKSNDTEIYYTPKPSNPEELLTQHDKEYLGAGLEHETFTKEFFWKTDINGKYPATRSKDGYIWANVINATQSNDGTWRFIYDSGEISGFKEGKDFIFGPSINNEDDVPGMTIRP